MISSRKQKRRTIIISPPPPPVLLALKVMETSATLEFPSIFPTSHISSLLNRAPTNPFYILSVERLKKIFRRDISASFFPAISAKPFNFINVPMSTLITYTVGPTPWNFPSLTTHVRSGSFTRNLKLGRTHQKGESHVVDLNECQLQPVLAVTFISELLQEQIDHNLDEGRELNPFSHPFLDNKLKDFWFKGLAFYSHKSLPMVYYSRGILNSHFKGLRH